MNKSLTRFLLIIITMAFVAAGCNPTTDNKPVESSEVNKATAKIGEAELIIDIARTIQERDRGLGGRESLGADEGMLFIFDAPGRYGFWMKDMNFPIDIIWISNGLVVEISPDVQHQPGVAFNDLKVYSPTEAIDSVLETNAGWAAENGIKIGDSVSY